MYKRPYAVEIPDKFVDNLLNFSDSTLQLPFNGSMSLLTGVSEGLGTSERVGTEITVTEIDMKMFVKNPTTKPDFQALRVVIFIWYGTLAPLPSSIIIPIGPGHMVAPYEYSTRAKYQILYDKVFDTVNAAQGMWNSSIYEHWCMKTNNKIYFNQNVTPLGVGDIYVLNYGDTTYTAGDSSLIVSQWFRIKYRDY